MRYSTILYAQGSNVDNVDTRATCTAPHIDAAEDEYDDCEGYFANAELFSRRSFHLRRERVTGKLYSMKD